MALRAHAEVLAAADVNHQRRDVFEFVEPVGDFARIQRAPGEHGFDTGGIDDLGIGRGEPIAHAAIKRVRHRLVSTVDQGHGSRLRRSPNRREASGLPGETQRERREQRLDDRRRIVCKLLVGGAGQHQHAGIADRNHIRGARNICEETDFADQFAGTEFGDRFDMAGPAHRQRTVQHHEQCVGRPPLRHQHLPAHEILTHHRAKGLQPLFGAKRPEQREVLRWTSPRKYRVRFIHGRPGSLTRRNVNPGQPARRAV